MISTFLVTFLMIYAPSPAHTDLHAFHLSKSEIYYNKNNLSFEISLHLFIDDLEEAMKNAGMVNPYISTSKEIPDADSLISVYLDEHFSLIADGQKINFNFLGKEDSEDLIAIWCYLEGEEVENPKEITLQNKLLVEVFDDQKNIVAFRSEKKQEFLLFDIKKQEATIQL